MTPEQLLAWLTGDWRSRTLVMGVLNVTPDSFSDGRRFLDASAAVVHAQRMADEGADLIDVGGESTRPGSEPVPASEQISRVVPVLTEIRKRIGIACSIDTRDASVAQAALDAGALVVNDISAGRDDPQMLPLVAGRGVPVIFMHMQGTPATMQVAPTYHDVVAEVRDFLAERIRLAEACGIDRRMILVDPGIGFGKTTGHNLELLRRQRELMELGRPVVIGTSRKRFIGEILDEPEPSRRVHGTAATVAWAVANGAAVVRVHDVGPCRQVVRVIRAVMDGGVG